MVSCNTGLEELKKNISSWNVKPLSQVDRLVMIKSLIELLPDYLMSCFPLPKHLVKELHQIIFKFWHYGDIQTRKMTRDVIYENKFEGGLGLRDLYFMNEAFLAKIGWKLLTEHDSLVSQFLKAKYFPSTEFLRAARGLFPSLFWESIL